MAKWIDIFSLFATVAILGGLVWAIIAVVRAVSSAVESTKEHLKTRGVDVSQHGMSVKTNKHYDREHYLDDTQRRIVQAYNNSTWGQAKIDEIARSSSSDSSNGRSRTTPTRSRH